MMDIAYPFRIDSTGRTASSDAHRHIRDMIEQVLFTIPGERVNRPDFGCGLMQLIFAANSSELASATQFLVQGQIQQWLGELIQVEAVKVESENSVLNVIIPYRIRRTEQLQVARFSREV